MIKVHEMFIQFRDIIYFMNRSANSHYTIKWQSALTKFAAWVLLVHTSANSIQKQIKSIEREKQFGIKSE